MGDPKKTKNPTPDSSDSEENLPTKNPPKNFNTKKSSSSSESESDSDHKIIKEKLKSSSDSSASDKKSIVLVQVASKNPPKVDSSFDSENRSVSDVDKKKAIKEKKIDSNLKNQANQPVKPAKGKKNSDSSSEEDNKKMKIAENAEINVSSSASSSDEDPKKKQANKGNQEIQRKLETKQKKNKDSSSDSSDGDKEKKIPDKPLKGAKKIPETKPKEDTFKNSNKSLGSSSEEELQKKNSKPKTNQTGKVPDQLLGKAEIIKVDAKDKSSVNENDKEKDETFLNYDKKNNKKIAQMLKETSDAAELKKKLEEKNSLIRLTEPYQRPNQQENKKDEKNVIPKNNEKKKSDLSKNQQKKTSKNNENQDSEEESKVMMKDTKNSEELPDKNLCFKSEIEDLPPKIKKILKDSRIIGQTWSYYEKINIHLRKLYELFEDPFSDINKFGSMIAANQHKLGKRFKSFNKLANHYVVYREIKKVNFFFFFENLSNFFYHF